MIAPYQSIVYTLRLIGGNKTVASNEPVYSLFIFFHTIRKIYQILYNFNYLNKLFVDYQ